MCLNHPKSRRSLGEVLLGRNNGSRDFKRSTTLSSQGIEDENRINIESGKSNRKSCSLSVIEATTVSNDGTLIFYSYGRHSVPYLSRMPGKNITLQQFKTLLPRKGNFKYLFKTGSNDSVEGAVFEEVNEDHKILPICGDKVFCVIEGVDGPGHRYMRLQEGNSNQNSCSPSLSEEAAANPVSNDGTVIIYSYGHDSVPFLSEMPGKNITLQQFKTLLPKTGNFRYFFKTASNNSVSGEVFEEVNEDHKILPLCEGEVICVIEALDDTGIEYLRLHNEMQCDDEIIGQILSGHPERCL